MPYDSIPNIGNVSHEIRKVDLSEIKNKKRVHEVVPKLVLLYLKIVGFYIESLLCSGPNCYGGKVKENSR